MWLAALPVPSSCLHPSFPQYFKFGFPTCLAIGQSVFLLTNESNIYSWRTKGLPPSSQDTESHCTSSMPTECLLEPVQGGGQREVSCQYQTFLVPSLLMPLTVTFLWTLSHMCGSIWTIVSNLPVFSVVVYVTLCVKAGPQGVLLRGAVAP